MHTTAAFELHHGARGFLIYNNTAYGVSTFLDGSYYADSDTDGRNESVRSWNNLVARGPADRLVIYERSPRAVDWSIFLAHSDHNAFVDATSIAAFAYGAERIESLSAWQAIGFDRSSLATSESPFTDEEHGDFRLRDGSSLRSMGAAGEDIGAYPTGAERIGPSW